ncbi:MAG: tRNA-intron lyase [Desulfurococcaceae archaeon]
MVNNRVLVTDYDCASKLYWDNFFGSFLGVYKPQDKNIKSVLELSLIEALYLLEKEILKIYRNGVEIRREELIENAEKLIKDFHSLYIVYRDLRERGFVVRRGLKFGCHFLVYRFGPGIDHAPFGVEVISREDSYDPIMIVRLGRLLHSVRKKLILAITNKDSIEYVLFSWWKP